MPNKIKVTNILKGISLLQVVDAFTESCKNARNPFPCGYKWSEFLTGGLSWLGKTSSNTKHTSAKFRA